MQDDIGDSFKHAMRRLATTVALITAGSGDTCGGMAATAITSVSTEPPTILVAVNRNASIHPTLSADTHFCVNLLSPRHGELVSAFSGMLKGLDRFAVGEWRYNKSGLPILVDAMASLVSRTTMRVDVGTHTLFIGEVEEVVNHDEISPLVWMEGGFASAAKS